MNDKGLKNSLISFIKKKFYRVKIKISEYTSLLIFKWKLSSSIRKIVTLTTVALLMSFSILLIIKPRIGRILLSGNYGVYKNLRFILNNDRIKIHMIDCDQGDAILIEADNKIILIDAGPVGMENTVTKYISALTDRIDIVILTHPHNDHLAAAPSVMRKFKPKVIFLSHDYFNEPIMEEVHQLAKSSHILVKNNLKGTIINLGENITLECLHPDPVTYSKVNNYSGVYKLNFLEKTFLFLGDLEKDIFYSIDTKNNLDIDFLKAGHHGSETSMDKEFLLKTSPEFVGISVGYKNLFKHPSEKVKLLLESNFIPYSRTDLHGTIVITSNGKRILHN